MHTWWSKRDGDDYDNECDDGDDHVGVDDDVDDDIGNFPRLNKPILSCESV